MQPRSVATLALLLSLGSASAALALKGTFLHVPPAFGVFSCTLQGVTCQGSLSSMVRTVGLAARVARDDYLIASAGLAAVTGIVAVQSLSSRWRENIRRAARAAVLAAGLFGALVCFSVANWGSQDTFFPIHSGFASFFVTEWMVQTFSVWTLPTSIGFAGATTLAVTYVALVASARNFGANSLRSVWEPIRLFVVPCLLVLEAPLLGSYINGPPSLGAPVIYPLWGTPLGGVLTNAGVLYLALSMAFLGYFIQPVIWLIGNSVA